MAGASRAFAVQATEGVSLATPTGDSVVIKADSSQTNGSMTAMDLVIAAHSGPALHIHNRDDELWFVVAGDFRFRAGDAILHATAGGMAFGPKGTPHCFQNVGDDPGRLFVITSPAGIEGFFRDFAAAVAEGGGPELLHEVGLAHGLDFVGPPLAVSHPL